jgi:predicted glycogen debranching enzyme
MPRASQPYRQPTSPDLSILAPIPPGSVGSAPIPLRFGPQVCGSLDAGGAREWLVPDGLGGYAMGTVSGLRTRRYHGLLVVAGDVPARRMMALAALDPILVTPGGTPVRLATHEWSSGAIEPRGHQLLESFELVDGLPRWRWRVGDVVLQRELALRYGSPSVAVVFTVLAGGPVQLRVEALCTWRDAHGERHAGNNSAGGELRFAPAAGGVVVEDAYRLVGPGFDGDPQWYLGAYHREEAARGLAPSEDLLRIGSFGATVPVGGTLGINAWAGDLATPPPPADEVLAAARARARALVANESDPVVATLVQAADAFVVRTTPAGAVAAGAGAAGDAGTAGSGVDVVAGYPWFGAWSRDTMISYDGLFLATGRAAEGRELLLGYAATLSEGMLANTCDTGQVEHNTADATLWFLHAVDRHIVATGDVDLAAALVGPLDAVIGAHLAGTRYGIRIDPADGLLTQGADGSALTWMDAVVGGVPVTPRRGKAVELNALWINGVAGLAALRRRLGRDHADLDKLGAQATASFRRRFPAPSGWLYDLVDTPGPDGANRDDPALRPNQLLAFGLPYAPLRGTDPAPVRAVGRALLTPLGPRSLAPLDPQYRGAHRGDPVARDHAYHQGTVWPWLIGPYADAAAAVGLATPMLLDGLVAHLGEWGVGSVSETADGAAPHDATGCPFQAWSVAETLRVYRTLSSP